MSAVEKKGAPGGEPRASSNTLTSVWEDGGITPPVKPTHSPAHSHSVEEVYKVLGNDAVLLSLVPGQKKPKYKGWPKTSLADTRKKHYQKELATGDIGVVLGAAGNGICTIDCDSDEAATAFLTLNPHLANTLHTRGSRGRNIWLRVKGAVPNSCRLQAEKNEIGEWRADGNQTKIAGIHPQTKEPYQWVVDVPVMETSFDDITWPVGWIGDCIETDFQRLIEKFGTPFEPSKTGVRLNQSFFAAKFAHENSLLFEADENRFFYYAPTSGLWLALTEAKLKTMVLADLMDFSATQDPELKGRFALARTDQYATAVARLLRGQVERRGVFSTPRQIVHVLNGVIEIGGGGATIRGFAPDDFSRNQIPVKFDPAATCPQFEKDILQPALGPDDIRLLQKWVGGVLLGGNFAQKMMIFEGGAGTSKSTICRLIGLLVGTDNVTQLRTELLHERFEIARFVGKRLLAGRDVSGSFLERKGAAVLKAITGGDDLSTESKGTMGQSTVAKLDVMVTTNCRLRVRLENDVGAWARRLLIIPFHRPPPLRPIPDFAEKLFGEEGQGILNWAITGALTLLAEMDLHGRLQVTAGQQKRVDDLLAESDSVRAYLRADVAACGGLDVTTDELVKGYKKYCEGMDWQPRSVSEIERALPDLMMEQFGVSKRNDIQRNGKGQRGYADVTIPANLI